MESFAAAARRLCGQAGLLLGWRPEEFWRSTPDEIGDALRALHGQCGVPEAPLDRAMFARLMEIYPDGTRTGSTTESDANGVFQNAGRHGGSA